MKKRILAFCLCLGMFFGFTGCSQSKLERFSDDEALLLVNGEVIMTALDFKRLTIQQTVSHDIKKTEVLSEKKLFIQQAQIALLSYFATEYGLAYDRSALEEEYDAHMLEIQDTELYGNELLFATTLQGTLGMDNTTFRTWSINESIKDYNIDALLEDLALLYTHITNEEILKEFMQENLLHLYEIYEVEICYPGVTVKDLDFSELL